MAYRRSILSQIVENVNRYEFRNQVSKYQGDYKVSKLNCFNLLILMIFVHLKPNKTLRDIAICFKTAVCSLYHLGVKSYKRSTISDSLTNRPAKVYEDFYYYLLSTLNRKEKRKMKMKINLIDSTTISLCLSKFDWAKYRKAKGGIKLHVLIDSETHLAEQIIMTNAVVHDMKAIKDKIDFKKGQMYVYDRGYACYKYLYSIELAKAFFVTRLKSNWTINVIQEKEAKGKGILADQIIEVDGNKNNDYPKHLRLVTFYHEESKKTLKFITNNFRLSAKRIANIYKIRWQIELFFKWMKQHLKIKQFLSTSENGVKIQIWTALITHILLHKIKTMCNFEIDAFTLYRYLQDHLFSITDLFELITQTKKEAPPDDPFVQLELKYV